MISMLRYLLDKDSEDRVFWCCDDEYRLKDYLLMVGIKPDYIHKDKGDDYSQMYGYKLSVELEIELRHWSVIFHDDFEYQYGYLEEFRNRNKGNL